MTQYRCAAEYRKVLAGRAQLAEGFRAAAQSIIFQPAEKPGQARMNLALIQLEEETPLFAAVFTRNQVAGAPVLLGRQRLGLPLLKGVLINNKVANVAAPGGLEDARSLLEHLGRISGTPGERYLAASTGVIGWRLPLQEMREALPALVGKLQGETILPAAEAIMTTDSFPKLRARRLGEGRLVGIAKGAGMIEPNLATMLVFLLTDVSAERGFLREALSWCAQRSFNRISVDGDQSTSDMAVLLSSGRKPSVPQDEFREALLGVCSELAEDIVTNGEGVGHVIRVKVRGGGEEATALGAAKAVVNSPLVKTAVYGNDPNVGRILSALGDYLGNSGRSLELEKAAISLGGIEVFARGVFQLDGGKEQRLAGYLRECGLDPQLKGYPQHDRKVEILVDLGLGAAEAEALGADLSHEYIKENADYRS